MDKLSDKSVLIIAALAMMTSLFGLVSLEHHPFSTSGYGTTGEAKINITTLAELNVSVAVIDFGNGSIVGANCTLTTSESTGDPRNCFTPTGSSGDGTTRGFNVTNTGNVNLNVTVNSSRNATQFWGVSVDWNHFRWKCSGNGTAEQLASYTVVNVSNVLCTSTLSSVDGNDVERLDINITAPGNATGLNTSAIITFTGTQS